MTTRTHFLRVLDTLDNTLFQMMGTHGPYLSPLPWCIGAVLEGTDTEMTVATGPNKDFSRRRRKNKFISPFQIDVNKIRIELAKMGETCAFCKRRLEDRPYIFQFNENGYLWGATCRGCGILIMRQERISRKQEESHHANRKCTI